MPGLRASKTRIANLRRVFRADQGRAIDAHIARLCVLYGDLRIELFAIREDSIPCLDALDPVTDFTEKEKVGKYRRSYFLRRSIGTLCEFAEALRLISRCPEFASLAASFSGDLKTRWDASVNFFQAQEKLIRRVRHDIGGHFGSKAALFAVQNLGPTSVGNITLGQGFQLCFVGEITGVAFFRHLPGATVEDKVRRFFDDVLIEGWNKATDSVHVLFATHLWPRFAH